MATRADSETEHDDAFRDGMWNALRCRRCSVAEVKPAAGGAMERRA